MNKSDDPDKGIPAGALPADTEQLLNALRCGEIDSEYGLMRWSTNYTFLTSVQQDDLTVMAVYKPQAGERPLWDFPDGTLCYRENAAYLTSAQLGWDIVPPTILREGPRGLGTFQIFIDHDPEVNYFSFDASMYPQLMRLSLFDCLVNNADRKGGHCLLDTNGHLWGIDHGITFHIAPKLRTVVWDFAGQPIPDDLLEALSKLSEALGDESSSYRQFMSQMLAVGEMKTFHARVNQLLKTRKYPLPGPGPNYPWPPV